VNYADDLKRFFHVMSYAQQSASAHGEKRRYPFVTISRQAGAGGHTLAKFLLETMNRETDEDLFHGWQIFDQQLYDLLAQDEQLKASLESLLSEEYRSQVQTFVAGIFGRQLDQNIVMTKMFEAIRSLATVGKVIIVGRGGSQATRKLDLGVHVRLIAPEPARVRHLSTLIGQNEEEAKQRMRKQDADRARLVKNHFQVDIGDPLLYDVTWNTGTTPYGVIAEAILSLVKQRMQGATAALSATPSF